MFYLTGEGIVPGLRLVVGSWSVRDRRVEDVPRLRRKHGRQTTKPHP